MRNVSSYKKRALALIFYHAKSKKKVWVYETLVFIFRAAWTVWFQQQAISMSIGESWTEDLEGDKKLHYK